MVGPLVARSVYKDWKDTLSLAAQQGQHLGGTAAAAAKSPQLCLTLCSPTDGSPPGSAIPGILQVSQGYFTGSSKFSITHTHTVKFTE